MPNPSKIVNESEVLRWFEEGRTYPWMQAEYLRKYDIETSVTLWSNFRRRKGLPRRLVRDDDLIPWLVKDEHRWLYPAQMLRLEARRRVEGVLTEEERSRLENWKKMLKGKGVVVHYDSETEKGFLYVLRTSQDADIIRKPPRKTTRQLNRDIRSG